VGHGRAFFEKACALSIEGTVSKRIDAPYAPGNPRALDQPKILRISPACDDHRQKTPGARLMT
jgi:hypothetical protein